MSIAAAYLLPHPPLAVPQVGQGRELAIADTIAGFRRAAVEIAALRPQVIVLFSPHATQYADYFHIAPGDGARGSLASFGAPGEVQVHYDNELAGRLALVCGEAGLPAGTLGERGADLDHGALVPLHFINREYTDYRLVRVSPSGLTREEHYRMGMLLRRAIEELGRSAVVIASGDLSHKLTEDGPYGFAGEGPELDAALTGIVSSGAFDRLFALEESLCEKGAECGVKPLLMLAGCLDGRAVEAELLSYEGPFGVGYGVASFRPGEADASRLFLEASLTRLAEEIARRREREDDYARLARLMLEQYVRTGGFPALPPDLPAKLTRERAGVFVSIKKHGALRGCIGTTEPTQPSIAEEIRTNAISAGRYDPRFAAVSAQELEELTYSVDVISPPEPTDWSGLDPARFGVVVTSGQRRGLLLPDLEGVDTAEQQVAIAREKAGIGPDEPVKLQRFEVVRHL